MNSNRAWLFGPTLAFALFLLTGVPSARASLAAIPGDVTFELVPSAAVVHVVHQDLLIDLRPVDDDEPARIKARYELRNDGPARSLSLFLVGPADRQGSFRHNGRVLRARSERRTIPDAGEPQLGLAFDVVLAPGTQTLDVEYLSRAEVNYLDLVDRYALDYAFAPAQHWSSYGTLSVRVELPEGWEVLEAPGLQSGAVAASNGDSSSRTWKFRALPTAPLRFQTAPPKAPYLVLVAVQAITCVLAVLSPFVAALRLRRKAREQNARVSARGRLSSFVLCLLAVALLPLVTVPVDLYWLTHRAPNHAHMLETVLAWALGAALCVLSHALVGWSPKAPPAGR